MRLLFALGVLGLVNLTALCLSAAEARHLSGELIALAPGVTDTPFVVGFKGASFHASEPATLTGTIALERQGGGGLTASVVAHSLRGTTEDDWRLMQTIAGTRHDPQIDFPNAACGTPAERERFGVGGSDADWENFSIQWDGWLRVSGDNTDIATSSDDGSRVWLDLNDDGKISPDEWGSNGWGNGQGTTQRTVHRNVKSGAYRMRVQYEDGNGGNSCRLLWNAHASDGAAGWSVIPVEGLTSAAQATFAGPVTLAGVINGPGTLSCGDGVRVGGVLAVETIRITGQVVLTSDLLLTAATVLDLDTGSRLDLAGHRLEVQRLTGDGMILLSNGRLLLPSGIWAVHVEGSGELVTPGALRLSSLSAAARVSGGPIRTSEGCIARIPLAAPLTTVLLVTEDGSGERILEVQLDIPPDAPAGLGVGAWRADRQGRWFQQVHPQRLRPGRHTLRFSLDTEAALGPEGHRGRWSADAAVGADRVGLFLFADVPSVVPIGVTARLLPLIQHDVTSNRARLTDLHVDGQTSDGVHGHTGQRWSLTVRPQPYPQNPFDPADFTLELSVTQPDGAVRQFAGFHDEPQQAVDRGDREEFVSNGAPAFHVRYRPGQAGVHHLQLTAHWRDGSTVVMALPDLLADGAPWDDIVRVDPQDPRFFSAGGTFVWPVGCNLNSTYDVRSVAALQTKLTPDRGSFTREALLTRLAAGGGSGCETWLSPWNLGLEWNPKWPGFRGVGRYHQGHAWALDQFLDQAEHLGIRVNLSLFNHGMARDGTGEEEDWRYHPYNRANGGGGWLDGPAGLFSDSRAFAQQQLLFRYLAARYGDSPALLGWKLWAEVNLAHAPHEAVVDWHARASVALHAVDPWHHPVTTHWCGDWTAADLAILAHPGIDYATIDAYHGDETAIAELLNLSTRDPLRRRQGLASTGKPVLVTEFGGNAGGTSIQRMEAEYVIGPWAGLVAGHAGAPMLWWFEWLDQGDRFSIYGAVNRYLVGEDLRGVEAQCVAPQASAASGGRDSGRDLWCRAWSRPGRMLGYLLDRTWGLTGGPGQRLTGATVQISDDAKGGSLHLEWWDAEAGTVIAEETIVHPGGRLVVNVPPFSRHVAFKLWRIPATP